MDIKFFKTESETSPVEDFILNSLEPKDQKKVDKALKRVYDAKSGLANLFKAKYAKPLEQDLFELTPGRVRVIFTLRNSVCWLLHIFFKKTQKTPKNDLRLARNRKEKIFIKY